MTLGIYLKFFEPWSSHLQSGEAVPEGGERLTMGWMAHGVLQRKVFLGGAGRRAGQCLSWTPNRRPHVPRLSPVKHRFVHAFIPCASADHTRVGPVGPLGTHPHDTHWEWEPPPHSTNQRCIHCRSHTRCMLSHRLAHTHPPPHSHTDGGDGLGPGRKYPINVYPVTHGPSQEPVVG